MKNEKIEVKKKDMMNKKMKVTMLIAIIILVLGAACFIGFHLRESNANVTDNRAPVITIDHIYTDYVSGAEDTYIQKFTGLSVEIENSDNLKSAYIISPDNDMERLKDDDFEKEIEEYFKNTYKSKLKPDMVKDGGIAYYYRFIAFEAANNTTDVVLLYYKTWANENGHIQVKYDAVDSAKMMELEKAAHEGDFDEYAGEREMITQYNEIQEHYCEGDIAE